MVGLQRHISCWHLVLQCYRAKVAAVTTLCCVLFFISRGTPQMDRNLCCSKAVATIFLFTTLLLFIPFLFLASETSLYTFGNNLKKVSPFSRHQRTSDNMYGQIREVSDVSFRSIPDTGYNSLSHGVYKTNQGVGKVLTLGHFPLRIPSLNSIQHWFRVLEPFARAKSICQTTESTPNTFGGPI